MTTLNKANEINGTNVNFLAAPVSLMLRLLPLDKLRASEKINIWRARSLAKKIACEGIWTKPILIEERHYVVMDGHHRLWVAHDLGLSQIPCIMLSYQNPALLLTRWTDGEPFSPELVIEAGKTGELLDYKTTRHVLKTPIEFSKYPLAMLQENGTR